MKIDGAKKARGFGLGLILFASLAAHASAQVERIVGGPQFILWRAEWWLPRRRIALKDRSR